MNGKTEKLIEGALIKIPDFTFGSLCEEMKDNI